MHGPITKPKTRAEDLIRQNGSFDRAAVMRFAWAKLATNYRLFDERRTSYRMTFREALREAWNMAKHMRDRHSDLAEIAAAASRQMTAAEIFAARRFAAECCESDARRRAELSQIDREERAARAA